MASKKSRPPQRPAVSFESKLTPFSPWLRRAVLVLAGLAIFFQFYGGISRTDLWWHLKTGEYIWQHRSLPVPDPFAYTTYMGQPAYAGEAITRYFNLTHEWLSQVIFYLFYCMGGLAGVIVLRQILMTALFGTIGLVVYQRCGGFYRAVGAAFAAVPVVSFLTGDRPFLFTYLFLAGTILILERRRPLWLLPPLFLVWANCHSGFFLGWVALGAYCTEALVMRWQGKPAADERKLFLVTAACMLASGLNPNGYRVFQVLVLYRQSTLQMHIFEWQRPKYWEVSSFTLVLYGAAAVLLWVHRRVRISDVMLYLVIAAAALTAARNVPLMGIIGPVIIFSYVPWKWRVPVLAEVVVALLVANHLWGIIPRPPFYPMDESDLPAGAANFLLAHHIRGRMFNVYDEGGYLIWRLGPEQQVFLDGRALNESAAADHKRIAYNADSTGGPSGQELLDQYGIDLIVMPMLDGFGDTYLLPASLADPSQTTWKLIYRDARSVIFVKRVPEGLAALNPMEALTSMEMMCNQTLERGGFHRCARSLGRMFAIVGDQARAAQWMGVYNARGNAPDSPLTVR